MDYLGMFESSELRIYKINCTNEFFFLNSGLQFSVTEILIYKNFSLIPDLATSL